MKCLARVAVWSATLMGTATVWAHPGHLPGQTPQDLQHVTSSPYHMAELAVGLIAIGAAAGLGWRWVQSRRRRGEARVW